MGSWLLRLVYLIFIRLIGTLALLLRSDAAAAVLVQGVEGPGR
jgi:hypothetical protein